MWTLPEITIIINIHLILVIGGFMKNYSSHSLFILLWGMFIDAEKAEYLQKDSRVNYVEDNRCFSAISFSTPEKQVYMPLSPRLPCQNGFRQHYSFCDRRTHLPIRDDFLLPQIRPQSCTAVMVSQFAECFLLDLTDTFTG